MTWPVLGSLPTYTSRRLTARRERDGGSHGDAALLQTHLRRVERSVRNATQNLDRDLLTGRDNERMRRDIGHFKHHRP